ncbi:MAG: alpha/beta fold hydrolase [Pseudomonadales bacterium]|jgi:pimeloyl-ACP methyl ester carboxylesterase|tara:strand:- start:612 stop:1355 length:744 start_codon:yes stop_codon:yes gene_type:complete
MEVQVDGATLYVEVDGSESSPALLLWHPGRCTLRSWDHLVPLLAEHFHVVRIDVRGIGQSSPSEDPAQYILEQYAEDACVVLDHLGIERCHVWSQSGGTRQAFAFCALSPDRVITAALYAANTDPADMAQQQAGSKIAAQERRKLGIEKPPRPPEGFFEHKDAEAAVLATQANGKFDLAAVIDKLTIPVLIGTGSHDPNLVSSRVIAATAPNAKLVVLENVGHNSMWEYPALALQTFLDFHESLETG